MMDGAFACVQKPTLVAADASDPEASGLRVIVCVAFTQSASPDEISALKATVIACPSVLHAVEVTGTFDFLMELTVPDIATFNDRLKVVAACVATLVERYEVNFVSRRFTRKISGRRSIWLQGDEGLTRIDHALIDKVTAEGDYMRVHSNGRTWMLHATMRSLLDRLVGDDFIQLHRSTIVRANFIDEMIHRDGRWIAHLHDGTKESVAKSHVADTLGHLRAH
jgi:DNA-binding LytR/AlgR family response regulator